MHEPFSSPSSPNVKHTSFSFQDNFWNTILFVQENNSSSQKLSFEGFMAWLWIMGTLPIGRASHQLPQCDQNGIVHSISHQWLLHSAATSQA